MGPDRLGNGTLPPGNGGGIGGFFSGLPIIGPIIQSIGNWVQGRRNTDKTIKANKEMAQYEYEKNLEMWMRGNEYNAPEAQMERLRQAGLNPNLVYGSGSAPGMSAGQLPKYNRPNIQYDYPAPEVTNMLSQYQDFTLKQAQTDNVLAQNKVIEESGMIKELDRLFKGETFEDRRGIVGSQKEQAIKRSRLLGQEWYQKSTMFPYNLDLAKGKISLQQMEQMLGSARAKKMDQETEYLQKQNKYYLTKMWANIISQGAGAVGKFVPRIAGGKGKATPGGSLQKAQPTKAQERAFNETSRRMQNFGNNKP